MLSVKSCQCVYRSYLYVVTLLGNLTVYLYVTVHCPKSNTNFRDITRKIVENMIVHEIFRVLSRFPRYISCYIAEIRKPLERMALVNWKRMSHQMGGSFFLFNPNKQSINQKQSESCIETEPVAIYMTDTVEQMQR